MRSQEAAVILMWMAGVLIGIGAATEDAGAMVGGFLLSFLGIIYTKRFT